MTMRRYVDSTAGALADSAPAVRLVSALCALLAFAWLIPHHAPPWLSAFPEAFATTCLLLAVVWTRHRGVIDGRFVAALIVALGMGAIQLGVGRVVFASDLLIVTLYLWLFALAICVGSSSRLDQDADTLTVGLATGWVAGAVLSIGTALLQWLSIKALGEHVADLPPGVRPFGNVAQPNHLSTIAFLGIVGLALLHEAKRIGRLALWAGCAYMVMGMVMTQSRTGWLQAIVLGVFVMVMAPRFRWSRWWTLAGLAMFAAATASWPTVDRWLLLDTSAPLEQRTAAGTRPLHWAALAAATLERPWLGHGWLQTAGAKREVALEHPAAHEYVEHAHNLVLDLVVWMGFPAGLTVAVLILWWWVARTFRCRDPRAAWLLLAVGGVGAHAMVEYPLYYLYFLLPVGVAIGLIDAFHRLRGPVAPSAKPLRRPWAFRAPAPALWTSAVVVAGAFATIAVDYLRAEDFYRTVRLEAARIGTAGIVTKPPDLRVLGQIEAQFRFIVMPVSADMDPTDLRWMERTLSRYGSASFQYKFARALQMNGQTDRAETEIMRLCATHQPDVCSTFSALWSASRSGANR